MESALPREASGAAAALRWQPEPTRRVSELPGGIQSSKKRRCFASAEEGKRQRKPGEDQARPADQRAGVRLETSEIVRWFNPGNTAARYSFTGTSSRRQDSTTERIAATLGPDWALPTCSQFFLPSATGRIE